MLRGLYIYIRRRRKPREKSTPRLRYFTASVQGAVAGDVRRRRWANGKLSSLFVISSSLFGPISFIYTVQYIYIIYGRALLFPSAGDSDWQRHLPDLSTRRINRHVIAPVF